MSVADIIERVQAKLAAVDPTAERKCTGVIQFNLIDQRWTLDLDNLTLVEGDAEDANATVDMDNETFVELAAKTLTIEEAKESGRLTVSGDTALLRALHEVSKKDDDDE